MDVLEITGQGNIGTLYKKIEKRGVDQWESQYKIL